MRDNFKQTIHDQKQFKHNTYLAEHFIICNNCPCDVPIYKGSLQEAFDQGSERQSKE
jgi:hypothetical protein